MSIESVEQQEKEAAEHFVRQFVRIGAKSFPSIWRWGDDKAGYILGLIEDEARRQGLIR